MERDSPTSLRPRGRKYLLEEVSWTRAMRALRGWKRRGEAVKMNELGGRERERPPRNGGWCGMGGEVSRR